MQGGDDIMVKLERSTLLFLLMSGIVVFNALKVLVLFPRHYSTDLTGNMQDKMNRLIHY